MLRKGRRLLVFAAALLAARAAEGQEATAAEIVAAILPRLRARGAEIPVNVAPRSDVAFQDSLTLEVSVDGVPVSLVDVESGEAYDVVVASAAEVQTRVEEQRERAKQAGDDGRLRAPRVLEGITRALTTSVFAHCPGDATTDDAVYASSTSMRLQFEDEGSSGQSVVRLRLVRSDGFLVDEERLVSWNEAVADAGEWQLDSFTFQVRGPEAYMTYDRGGEVVVATGTNGSPHPYNEEGFWRGEVDDFVVLMDEDEDELFAFARELFLLEEAAPAADVDASASGSDDVRHELRWTMRQSGSPAYGAQVIHYVSGPGAQSRAYPQDRYERVRDDMHRIMRRVNDVYAFPTWALALILGAISVCCLCGLYVFYRKKRAGEPDSDDEEDAPNPDKAGAPPLASTVVPVTPVRAAAVVPGVHTPLPTPPPPVTPVQRPTPQSPALTPTAITLAPIPKRHT